MKHPVVALDIGNVCIDLHYDRCRRAFGLAENEQIPEELFTVNNALECGRITVQEFLAGFRRRFPAMTDQEIIRNWDQILGSTRQDVYEKVRKLAFDGVKFVFFSDISILSATSFLRSSPLADIVQDAVFSYEAGAQKPADLMYETFEREHGIPDYYFDDKLCNIEAARKRGWNAVQYFNPEQLDAIKP